MPNDPTYEVLVGNIGCVYSGSSGREAQRVYTVYVGYSKDGYGRVAGEAVTLLKHAEILREYPGTLGDV